jgi:hypothetical protein
MQLYGLLTRVRRQGLEPRTRRLRAGEDGRVPADNLPHGSGPFAYPVEVPLTADSVGPLRLVYGGLDLFSADGRDQAYTAVYFEVAASGWAWPGDLRRTGRHQGITRRAPAV